jgi:hypothetical protein
MRLFPKLNNVIDSKDRCLMSLLPFDLVVQEPILTYSDLTIESFSVLSATLCKGFANALLLSQTLYSRALSLTIKTPQKISALKFKTDTYAGGLEIKNQTSIDSLTDEEII